MLLLFSNIKGILMRFYTYFLAVIFLINFNFAQKQYSGQNIEEILKLPEDQINIGIASLVLAKEFYPNLNIPFFLQTFDYMADRYKFYFGKYTDPDERVRALNTYLYKTGYWNDNITFGYDDADLEVTKLDNKFINGYISTKKGSCITMPMLYVILGERLNFPIKPVRSAKHFFVRYEPEKSNKKFKQNIEATNGGGFISDKQYKDDVLIPEKAIKNGVYLRTLSKKEYIASLLLINANEYLKIRNLEKAKHYFKLAIKYDSTFSSAYMNYGMTVFGEARLLEEKLWDEQQAAIKSFELNNYSGNGQIDIPAKQTDSVEVDELLSNNIEKTLDKQLNFDDVEKRLKEMSYTPTGITDENVEQTLLSLEQQRELDEVMIQIEEKYKPEILSKIDEYEKYTGKANELGIVLEFPIEFFQKQAETIRKYKTN